MSVTLLSEGFEGSFPSGNGWSTGDANSSGTSAYWKDVNSSFGGEGTHGGSWKGYCAGVGKAGTDSNPMYQNSMSAYMSKSVNLAGLSSASLSFWYKIPSIESGNWDHLRAYVDSTKVFDVSASASSWTKSTINLNSYLGANRTLKFEFYSDSTGNAEGAYLDDILVTGEQAVQYADLQGYDCYATDSAQWGQAIGVQSQIKNAGTGAASPFQVAWYLSKDSAGSSDDILLTRTSGGGNYYSHGGIAANSYGSDFTVNLQLPSALPSGWTGTSFYVIQKTDSAGQVTESNENNNFGQIGNSYDRDPITLTPPPVQYADLQGYDCYATDSAQWGQAISVQSQIKNAGTGAASPFQVAWYLSKDSAGSSDDILLSRTGGLGNYYSHGGIAANSMGSDFTVNLQLPSALPSQWTGTSFYVIQKTDSAGQVNEGSNEGNNFGHIGNGYDRDPITITAPVQYPDLQGYDCYATDSAQWGQAISVQSQIKNAGPGASGSFQVAWYLSKDSAGSPDDILLSRTGGAGNYYSHGGIAANSMGSDFTVNLQLPSALPSGWTGTSFYVIQKTDSAGQVTESNENNNFGQIGNSYDRDPIFIVADDFANEGYWNGAQKLYLAANSNKIVSWIPFVEGSQNGKIDYVGDNDVFKFVSDVTGTATVNVSAPVFSELDSVVKVFDASGQLLTSQDAAHGTGTEMVTVPVVPGGRYYVEVASAGGSQGNYTLKLACAPSSPLASEVNLWLSGLEMASKAARYYEQTSANNIVNSLVSSGLSNPALLAEAQKIQSFANNAGQFGEILRNIKWGVFIADVTAKVGSGQVVQAVVDGLADLATGISSFVVTPAAVTNGGTYGALIGTGIEPGLGSVIGAGIGAAIGYAGAWVATYEIGNIYSYLARDFVIDLACTVVSAVSPQNQKLANGGLENGNLNGWTVTAGGQFPKLVTTAPASGTYALQLGDGGSSLGGGNTASIQQTVNISSSATAPRLSLKYKVQGTDGAAWDWMRVYINNTQIASWSTDTGGWQTFNYDLSAFKGQSVTLKLSSWTFDTVNPVNYFLDDLSIVT